MVECLVYTEEVVGSIPTAPIFYFGACSSVVERFIHTEEAVGSIPATPIQIKKENASPSIDGLSDNVL